MSVLILLLGCGRIGDVPDLDGDGHVVGDCVPDDAGIYPGAVERADGVDEDCDGTIDEGTADYDDDGDGYTEADGDCDDADADISPAELESEGDGIDNDCDGVAD